MKYLILIGFFALVLFKTQANTDRTVLSNSAIAVEVSPALNDFTDLGRPQFKIGTTPALISLASKNHMLKGKYSIFLMPDHYLEICIDFQKESKLQEFCQLNSLGAIHGIGVEVIRLGLNIQARTYSQIKAALEEVDVLIGGDIFE